MANNERWKILEQMLGSFISGSDRSTAMAGRIEVLLDKEFPDDEELQDFVTILAMYQPGGGEFLYDEVAMIDMCNNLLEILRSKINIDVN